MYLGNQPALSYTSFAKQDFTTSATTSYTLDHPVTNENEIALFINFVRQEPTTAYSASGTSLTLTSATSASDDMYCVFLGKAVQTVNPPSGSVGTAQIADLAVTSGKLASGVLPDNTPAFEVVRAANQTITNDTVTKINFNSEQFDTDNAYDNTTNYRFTVPSGKAGKYYGYLTAGIEGSSNSNFQYGSIRLSKNGTEIRENWLDARSSGLRFITLSINTTLNLAVGDYLEAYGYGNLSSGDPDIKAQRGGDRKISVFGAYKIIE